MAPGSKQDRAIVYSSDKNRSGCTMPGKHMQSNKGTCREEAQEKLGIRRVGINDITGQASVTSRQTGRAASQADREQCVSLWQSLLVRARASSCLPRPSSSPRGPSFPASTAFCPHSKAAFTVADGLAALTQPALHVVFLSVSLFHICLPFFCCLYLFNPCHLPRT